MFLFINESTILGQIGVKYKMLHFCYKKLVLDDKICYNVIITR